MKRILLSVISLFPAVLIVMTTVLMMGMLKETGEKQETVEPLLTKTESPEFLGKEDEEEKRPQGQILIHNAPLYKINPEDVEVGGLDEENPKDVEVESTDMSPEDVGSEDLGEGSLEEGIEENLEKGTVVTVIEQGAEFWRVEHQGREGYVKGEFIACVEEFDENLLKQVKLIVIDAGHQAKGDNATEPLGPGSSEPHARVTGGATGTRTGVLESELTLKIALQLEEELEERGYVVIQVREKQDVNISNMERSQVANWYKADAFIRIHANGSENQSARGAQTICPAEDNPFPIRDRYDECYLLSECVLDAYIAATGFQKEYVSERNDLAGINWCEVPVTLLEMGYMSNPEEDVIMQDTACQRKMVAGIANGIDQYFKQMGGKQ